MWGSRLRCGGSCRSTPIFFTEHDGVLRISDDVFALARLWAFELKSPDAKSRRSSCSADSSPVGKRFIRRFTSWQPGEFLWAESHGDGYTYRIQTYFEYLSTAGIDLAHDRRPYFRYPSTDGLDGHRTCTGSWAEELDGVVTRATERLIQVAGGRPIVIPLSGGRDSRLIAMKLKQLAYADVSCYSYGSPDGPEARVSRAVAEKLGYPWVFVRYDRDVWRRTRADPAFSLFCRRAHSLSQIECIQDWPAVQMLVDRIPLGSVFVPGHTLDFISGSHLPGRWEQETPDDWRSVEEAVVRLHLSLWPPRTLADVFGATAAESLWVAVLERVRASVARFEAPGSAAKVQGFEYFDWIERQSKFIVNSVRVYEGHGFDWWLPWWDEELLRFWASVPLSLRFGTRLRNHYVDTLQRSLGIDAPPRPDPPHRRCSPGILHDAVRSRSIQPIRHGLKGDGGWLPSREHPMSWYSLVEPEIAGWGYSGATTVNAYLSRRYVQP